MNTRNREMLDVVNMTWSNIFDLREQSTTVFVRQNMEVFAES